MMVALGHVHYFSSTFISRRTSQQISSGSRYGFPVVTAIEPLPWSSSAISLGTCQVANSTRAPFCKTSGIVGRGGQL